MEKYIDRIQEMEAVLNRSEQVFEEAEKALNNVCQNREPFQKLLNYYFGENYREDCFRDKTGQIPKNIPRGVLSEDAVCNLLTKQRELSFSMLKLATRLLEAPY